MYVLLIGEEKRSCPTSLNRDTDLCPYPPLSGSPCEHDGICVNTPGSYRCDCLPGFTGPRCEVNVNECESNPCQNEGTCIDERGGFRCICMPGT